MNFSLHRSISAKIAFISACIFCIFGFGWLLLGQPSLFQTAIPSTPNLEFQTNFSDQGLLTSAFLINVLVIIGLSSLAGIAVGLVARQQLESLRKLSFQAQDMVAKGADHVSLEIPHDELEELGESLQYLQDQKESLLRNMRDIMDHIAHDILTPITRLRAHAELQLHQHNSHPQVLETSGHVLEECDHILNLVNSVLKLAALESGLKVWSWEPLNLVELIQDGCELFEPVIEQNEQKLVLDLPDECMIRGDRGAVQRVISNLLDNAIKYTPEGGELTVYLRMLENKQIQLVFSDNGMGIDEKDHGLVFQRFYRGDQSRSKPGHGLGLSYCYQVVQAMGGEIELDSVRDQGSTFTITIPVSLDQVA